MQHYFDPRVHLRTRRRDTYSVIESRMVTGSQWKYWVEWRNKHKDLILSDTEARMYESTFDQLNTYSITLPTGTYLRKIWKCKTSTGEWLLGEFIHSSLPQMVEIKWRKIILTSLDSIGLRP